MKQHLLFILLVLLTLNTSRAKCTCNPIDLIKYENKVLSFAGICIGESREATERKLNIKIKVHQEYFLVGGQYASDIKVHGCKVTLQWQSQIRKAALESISIDLPPDGYYGDGMAMADRIIKRYPILAKSKGRRDSAFAILAFPDASESTIIINSEEHYIWLSPAALID